MEYHIGIEGYYNLYNAQLEHFHQVTFSSVEEKNKSEPTKRVTNVLIKCIFYRGERSKRVFVRDAEVFTTCKHRNIVTLLGLCDEGTEMILVFEYPSNGNLYDYLINIKESPILTWTQRLRICLDIAYGLKYLHYEMENGKVIIHGDLKSKCIGLDENWGAKIVQFGLCEYLRPKDEDVVHFKNSFGANSYRDPEFVTTRNLKRESDVYSLGVVMFEILCGRTADDHIYKKGSDTGLASVARRCFHEGRIQEIIDPIVTNDIGENKFSLNRGPSKKSLAAFLDIAYRCLTEIQNQRPTIKVVVDELEKALYFQVSSHSKNLKPFFSSYFYYWWYLLLSTVVSLGF
ncbi:probable receptor-like protein kinase At5g61350 [Rutidosis leptorrhynchoides]